jgi:hypothetical protein
MVSKYKLGKLAQNVENVYEKFGGSRKAFFQEFTGKQLVKMGKNIWDIYASLDQKLKNDAQVLNIIQAITKFFDIKMLLSTTKVLGDTEIDSVEEKIAEYAAYMKENFPEMRVLQKGHVFLKHVPEFLRMFHIASYFSDEAIESFHVIFNKYIRRIGNRKPEKFAELMFKYNKEDTWLHDRRVNDDED